MAVSAVGNSSYYLNMYAQLNRASLLSGLSSASVLKNTAVTPVSSLKKVSSQLSSSNAQFLREYQDSMANLLAKSQNLREGYFSSGKYGETADINKTADAVGEMINAYNSVLTTLNDNADMGTGVLQQMKRMLITPVSEQSLNMAGISVKKDGTLGFDKSAFLAAAEKDSSIVTDIIGKTASGFYSDALSGMNISSERLLNVASAQNSLSGINQSLFQSTGMSGYAFLNMYAKSGAYNLSNYMAAGSLLNMLV